MITPTFFRSIGKRYTTYQKERAELIGRSNKALSLSKRSIFALHRSDMSEAKKLLAQADVIFKTAEKRFKSFPELAQQGAYKAALEENAEAQLFLQFIQKKKWKLEDDRLKDPSTFLGGLSDATGEIVRYAIMQATEGNDAEVRRAHETTEMSVVFLLELDLAGPLRQKFDQAKKNLRSLERVLYDMSLKR